MSEVAHVDLTTDNYRLQELAGAILAKLACTFPNAASAFNVLHAPSRCAEVYGGVTFTISQITLQARCQPEHRPLGSVTEVAQQVLLENGAWTVGLEVVPVDRGGTDLRRSPLRQSALRELVGPFEFFTPLIYTLELNRHLVFEQILQTQASSSNADMKV